MNFQSDNEFVKGLLKLVNIISFSALYFICCIPVVTVGAASVSMSVTMNRLKAGEPVTYGEFLKGIKSYARQGTILWLIMLLGIGITIGSMYGYRMFDPISWPLYLVGIGMGTLCFLMIPWMFGCAGYFKTDSGHMLACIYYLAIKHLGYTFLYALIAYGLLLVGLLTLILFPIIPGVIFYLQAGSFNKIVRQYDKTTMQLIKSSEKQADNQ